MSFTSTITHHNYEQHTSSLSGKADNKVNNIGLEVSCEPQTP